jgi:beta-glucosidase
MGFFVNAVSTTRRSSTMYDVFSLPPITFPKNFLWGSATAAYQIEGDCVDAALFAHEAEWKWTPAGKACNSYALYKEDIDLVAQLGHQVYRFSINWSRIEPAEGNWNAEAVEHYVDLCRRLQAKGVKAYVTLYHGEHPLWYETLGGWKKIETLSYWQRFVRYIVPKLAEFVDGWIVLNEFNGGIGTDGGPRKYLMTKAHAMGYHIIKEFSQAPISSAHAFIHWQPRRYHDKLDRIACDMDDWMQNEFFFHAIRTGEFVYPFFDAKYDADIKGSLDFWAINQYTRHMADARTAKLEGSRYVHKTLRMIDSEFWFEEFFPEGTISNLERLTDKPVIITENGVACNDDRFRIVYLALHLCALREAIDRGVDLRGYFHWSLMDNWEWGSYTPHFGLCSVDPATFARTPRPSAHYFKEIIQHNGFDAALTGKYLTELPTVSRSAADAPAATGEMRNAFDK